MFDLRPVFLVCGLILAILALAMIVPAVVDATHGDADWRVFAASALASLILGLLFATTSAGGRAQKFTLRQIFLLTATGWIIASLAAAIPFAFSRLHLSASDAVFEAVSGTTATGSTILRDLNNLPPGILIWRALLQWLGGIGFVIMAVLVLPLVNVGGMGIFRLDSQGSGDRVLPRAATLSVALFSIYAGLTLLLTILLWAAGMSRFHALLHAMSSISCGGFSTRDGSIGSWHRPSIDWVILLGMLLGGAPFVLYLQLARRQWRAALNNLQIRWYLAIMGACSLVLWLWLWLHDQVKPLPALRHGAFSVVSVMTGTGYATQDYSAWQGLPVLLLFALSFIGGCAGSTAGGLKIFRIQILIGNMRGMIVRLLRPHAVLLTAPEEITESVLGYLFVYVVIFAIVAMALAMMGLDFFSAISTASAALANLGPGLTQWVGPMAGYASLPDAAKWLLAVTMLFGRVEIFVILVLFVPSFWRP